MRQHDKQFFPKNSEEVKRKFD
uniref:Uncharacterized protein n=1 Tax=Rhizophora mucronata TaxID=61149 RepID=A0A2P2LWH1_RHIMU